MEEAVSQVASDEPGKLYLKWVVNMKVTLNSSVPGALSQIRVGNVRKKKENPRNSSHQKTKTVSIRTLCRLSLVFYISREDRNTVFHLSTVVHIYFHSLPYI